MESWANKISAQFCCEPKITLKNGVFLKYRKAFLLRFSCFLLDEALPGCCKPSGSFQSSKKVDSDSFLQLCSLPLGRDRLLELPPQPYFTSPVFILLIDLFLFLFQSISIFSGM